MFYITALLAACILNCSVFAAGKSKEEKELPYYVDLRSDQGIYNGFILDSDKYIPVTRISFSGQTTLDDVRKETDSSLNRINLGEIRSIRMINPLFESQRYPGKEWCLVGITTLNGSMEQILVRPNLVICAQAQTSGLKKSWVIRTITELEVSHESEVLSTEDILESIIEGV